MTESAETVKRALTAALRVIRGRHIEVVTQEDSLLLDGTQFGVQVDPDEEHFTYALVEYRDLLRSHPLEPPEQDVCVIGRWSTVDEVVTQAVLAVVREEVERVLSGLREGGV